MRVPKCYFQLARRRHSFFTILVLIFHAGFTFAQHDVALHTTDSGKTSEHQAMLALVPAAEANFTAQRSGSWSNPMTWRGGQGAFRRIPNSGAKVVIPAGITVTYDVSSTAEIRWLRVDGKLRFAPDRITQLRVDTIVVTGDGTWEQGTANQPIAAGVSSTIVFTDSGAIDRAYDPTLLSRGLISQGAANIYGSPKTTFLPVISQARAGDAVITLASAPVGWRAGDFVVLTGVKLNSNGTEDEERTILSINGNTIRLNQPLSYDHSSPGLDALGRPAVYLTNFTRNVAFKSANTDYQNHENTQRRGHVMFMHSNKANINYASFDDLGRTDKTFYINDTFQEMSSPSGTMTAGTGTNVRGRYSLHLHRLGNEPSDSTPAMVRGCTSRNSPGWGFVNHGSYANFYDNAAYNMDGAAFVAETGDEKGWFKGNIAINMPGTGRNDELRGNHYLNDVHHRGDGFALRGNIVKMQDCIVTSAMGSAFTWINKFGESGAAIPAKSLPHPGFANNYDAIAWMNAPTTTFHDLTAIASNSGVESGYWMPFHPSFFGRNVIENFVAYNIQNSALIVPYTTNLTIRNLKATGYDRYANGGRAGGCGVAFGGTMKGQHVLDNINVSHFQCGVQTQSDERVYLLNNYNFNDVVEQFRIASGSSVQTIPVPDVTNSVLSFTPDADQPTQLNSPWGFNLKGIVTDSLGQYRVGDQNSQEEYVLSVSRDALHDKFRYGYYTDSSDGSNYLMLLYAFMDRLTNKVQPITYKIKFDTNWARSQGFVLGPNLGQYASFLGSPVIGINAGGPSAAGFSGDSYFIGGSAAVLKAAQIDKSAWNSAPTAVYKDVRYGSNFSYNIAGLQPGEHYTLRLHFIEEWHNEPSKRMFDVSINQQIVLQNFDIFADAGAIKTSVIKDFDITANKRGSVNVNFAATIDSPDQNALIAGLEILTAQRSLVTKAPILTKPAGIYRGMFNVAITSETPGVTIHYSVDGSQPTPTSPIYIEPIPVRSTTTIRAIARAKGMMDSSESNAVYTIISPDAPMQINAGSAAAASGFAPDTFLAVSGLNAGHFVRGYWNSTTAAVDTSAANAAPEAVYKDWAEQRWFGGFDFYIPNLSPNHQYLVRLHFIEPHHSAVNQRRFNVSINGALKLEGFDIFAAAGNAINKAVIIDLPGIRTDNRGTIYLRFSNGSYGGGHDNTAIVSGIEVLNNGQPMSGSSSVIEKHFHY